MAALNSKAKALLGPKAVMSIQDTLPSSVTPDHENLEPPEDLMQAMQNLTLNDPAGGKDVPMTDAPNLAGDSGDVTAGKSAKMLGRKGITVTETYVSVTSFTHTYFLPFP